MKKLKKITAFVLCLVLAGGTASQVSAWDYENSSPRSGAIRSFESTFEKSAYEYAVQATRMYYDSKTKDVYVMDQGSCIGGSEGVINYYKYGYSHGDMSEKNKSEIWYAYRSMVHDTDFYDESNNEISENEFEEKLLEYENNKDLISIDVTEGMQSFGYHRSDLVDAPDYSNDRNLTLDTQEITNAQLQAKIIIPDGIDLKVEWKSSDSNVAEVDSEGYVTAKGEGDCTITSEIEGIGFIEQYNITVEPYMTETEKAVKGYITSYKSGELTEKDMLNNIYALEEYSAGGHVITDIDADGAYELVTRSSDMKTIRIYEVSGDKIELANELIGIDKAEMIYVHGGDKTQCFYRTLEELGDSKTKVKVFQYNGPGTSMSNKLVCTVQYTGAGGGSDGYDVFDSNGNKVSVFTDEYKYISKSWRESFNDYCCDVAPITDYKEACQSASGSGELYSYTESALSSLDYFYSSYYTSDDYTVWRGYDYTLKGLDTHYVQQMMINEILGRHNYKFSDPEVTALMNKKYSYNADASVTLEQIFDSFNYYEKYNYDNLSKVKFGAE